MHSIEKFTSRKVSLDTDYCLKYVLYFIFIFVKSGVEQILEFLGIHSQHIVHQGCHMIFNAQGQPSGEAFIQFDGEISSLNVSNHKNGKCMFFNGKKYFIEVIQCSGEEMNLVLLGLLPSNLINVQQVSNNQAPINATNYLLYNQTPQVINQTAPNYYYPNQTRPLNQSCQYFQTNPLIQNSTISNQLITNNQYSNYPPQIFYYLTPPVSPSSAVILQQNMPGLIHHNPYHPNQRLLPTVEFVKLILKGAPVNVTQFDIMDFLKDCGEVICAYFILELKFF